MAEVGVEGPLERFDEALLEPFAVGRVGGIGGSCQLLVVGC
jgi:hypothetical protein